MGFFILCCFVSIMNPNLLNYKNLISSPIKLFWNPKSTFLLLLLIIISIIGCSDVVFLVFINLF